MSTCPMSRPSAQRSQEGTTSDAPVVQSQERVLALGDAVEELGHLEDYVKTVQPSKHDAVCLAVLLCPNPISKALASAHDFDLGKKI